MPAHKIQHNIDIARPNATKSKRLVHTSLNAYGKPRTPAPMKDMKMLAMIFRGWVAPAAALLLPSVI